MIILLCFAFISGFVTILAPCIWPLLPIVLSSSLAGSTSHRRPLGITLGVMLAFSVATLSISALVRAFGFNPNALRLVAVIVIGILGLAMIMPRFGKYLEFAVSRLTSRFSRGNTTESGQFSGGFITGLSLGLVWAPCAGPIFASIAALTATGQVTSSVVALTLAYVLGLGIPLFIFAYGSKRLVSASRQLNRYTGRIQQVFGVIMVLFAVAIYTNYDTVFSAKLLNAFPSFSGALTRLETTSQVTTELDKLTGRQNQPVLSRDDLFNVNVPSPEISPANTWLNTDGPLSIADLKGKVVLVDFWTYTCINCIRTLPHVTRWYDAYKDDGFVVLGIHTPEFEFEKDTDNVAAAIKQHGIHYPVAQDNNYLTWNNFANRYWPAEYLIDKEGNVRRVHFGEGGYEEMEDAIRSLLGLTGTVTSTNEGAPRVGSPEMYFGLTRLANLASNETSKAGEQGYTLPKELRINTFALEGRWNLGNDSASSKSAGKIQLHFAASNVYMVASAEKPVHLRISVDGTFYKEITVEAETLYTLFESAELKDRLLDIEVDGPGLEAFTFTFG